MITTRESGPKDNRVRYMAALVGPDLAKRLNLQAPETAVRVQIGNGQDAGRLRIVAALNGKFLMRKQPGGGFLATVKAGALDGLIATTFDPLIIEQPRFVPAGNGEGASVIVKLPDAMLAPAVRAVA